MTLILALGSSLPVRAAKERDKVCDQLAGKAKRTIWSSVNESAAERFCRKPWVIGRPDEFGACGLGRKANLFHNVLRNKWNAWFARNAEWATWGPRGVGPEWENGTIRGGFKRTFFGAGLAYTTSKIEIEKLSGRSSATITVCELDQQGKVAASQQRSFDKGKDTETQKISIRHGSTRVLGVVVDTPAGVKEFAYRARIITRPTTNDLGEVDGIADLHNHQMASLAFGGRLYWGEHTGDPKTALRPEEVTGIWNPAGDVKILEAPKSVIDIAVGTGKSLDANVLLKLASPGETDEGFFAIGGPRGLPHHADRSHQQVHSDWLKIAHEEGLNLIVVSVVNNDTFCEALSLLDPNGNIADRDGKNGVLKSWKSAGFKCSDHDTVVREIEAIHDLERKEKWYRVAMTPWHARQIIHDGDLAVVISLETDKPLSGRGSTYGKFIDQLDIYRALGVSTMQIVHESDSKFCGAARHRTLMEALNTSHNPVRAVTNFITQGFKSTYKLNSQKRNLRGLTNDGRALLDAMVARNMPIDLAHGSEVCRNEVLDYVADGYGFYDSHTKFEALLKPPRARKNPADRRGISDMTDYGHHVLDREKELLVTEDIIDKYLAKKVLLGLRAASVDVYDAPNSKVANTCPGSSRSLAQTVQYANDKGFDFAFGTDFNTGVSQLGPRYGKPTDRCYAAQSRLENVVTRQTAPEPLPPKRKRTAKIAGTHYYEDGLTNIGWLPEVAHDLDVGLKTPGAAKLKKSAEAYLTMWERTYASDGRNSTTQANDRKNDGERCLSKDACKSGHCQAGICYTPDAFRIGQSCRVDGECKTNQCSALDGVGRGECVCKENADCGSNQYCKKMLKNQCIAKQAQWKSCTGDDQCSSGQCSKWRPQDGQSSGICYVPNATAMGNECRIDLECKVGKCNSKKRCACSSDSDCGAGKWCDGGIDFKENQCRPKLAKGEVCGTIGEQKVGHRCKSGSCKVAGLKLKCK